MNLNHFAPKGFQFLLIHSPRQSYFGVLSLLLAKSLEICFANLKIEEFSHILKACDTLSL